MRERRFVETGFAFVSLLTVLGGCAAFSAHPSEGEVLMQASLSGKLVKVDEMRDCYSILIGSRSVPVAFSTQLSPTQRGDLRGQVGEHVAVGGGYLRIDNPCTQLSEDTFVISSID